MLNIAGRKIKCFQHTNERCFWHRRLWRGLLLPHLLLYNSLPLLCAQSSLEFVKQK